MRGPAVFALMLLAVLPAGCASSDQVASSSSASSQSPSPSAVPTTTAPAPSARQDVVPTLVNPKGSPPCGYVTRFEQQASMKTTHLSFAVAVVPEGAVGEVRVAYEIEGDTTSHVARFEDGMIRDGKHTTPAGTTVQYLLGDIGLLRVDDVVSEKMTKFLNRPRIITVSVDPQDRIRESNEDNNVLRLRVAPPRGRQSLAVRDNVCQVLKP